MDQQTKGEQERFKLRPQITCPHCWTLFPVEDVLWISEAPDLMGDSRLGESEKQRFLPIQFDVRGNAIDLKGFPCEKLACPNCHLYLPRPLLEMPPYFTSIVGAPASGKSYFLTSMIWTLRKVLPNKFMINFTDSDPGMNGRLHQYEALHFMNDNAEETAMIEKTQEHGELYNNVLINNQHITFLQPFLFSLNKTEETPQEASSVSHSMTLVVYDNAGESYMPVQGRDNAALPVTRHLAKTNCIFFTFDPIQDNRFRAVCTNPSGDPQLKKETADSFKKSPLRQEMILSEMIKRTRTYTGLRFDEKFARPIIVVVTKYDAWQELLPNVPLTPPWTQKNEFTPAVFDTQKVRDVSNALRKLLKQYIPEMVSTIEQFASDVTYIPVSATGTPPRKDEETGQWGFRMKDLKPIWIEVPILYALSKSASCMIASRQAAARKT